MNPLLKSSISSPDGLPQLIFTNGGDVMMADIHGRVVRTLVPSQGKGFAVGVANHWNSETVFWSDSYTKKVSLDHCLITLLLTVFIVSLSDCKTQGTSVSYLHLLGSDNSVGHWGAALEQLWLTCFSQGH